ncbi:MAG: ATP-binding protein, partial [Aestuariivirga sp.]
MAPAYFYTLYRNSLVRAVALAQPIFSTKIGGMAMVIVVQTRAGHDALVSSLLVKALRDQLLFGAVAISLALFGLGRGLAPLAKLGRQLQQRDARNLAPLPVAQVQREMRPLVDALNSALQRVEAQVAAQRRFVANAAHQIRTPLALLKTQSLVGRQARNKPEKDEALSAIGKNVNGLSRLATQLLTLARSEQGSALLRKDKLDISAIVRGAVEAMLPVSFERNIDLGFEGGDAPILIFGHSGLLHEALVNLIDNALRHTPQGGTVTARIREIGELVVIVVEDSGSGIAPQDREGVFERFQRGAGQAGEGSGLGLAIVKEIASAHLGAVELSERDPPPGLLVRITLPALREAA